MLNEENEDRWCILRTSAARTLRLAVSLAAADFDVWTPRRTERRRLPRGRKGYREIVMPIMPTFVFASADQVADLHAAIVMPGSPHPPFSLFRYAGRVPLVEERDIAALRQAEERAQREVLKSTRHVFPVGAHVRVPEGAFAGMNGIVETSDGRHALVCFEGSFRVRIAAWLLREDEVRAGLDIAA